MGIKGRRVHMIEELSETIISFQRGKSLQKHPMLAFLFFNFNDETTSHTKSVFVFLFDFVDRQLIYHFKIHYNRLLIPNCLFYICMCFSLFN